LAFVHFDEGDVVRHHLVQRIVRAYDEHTIRVAEQQMLLLGEPKSADPSVSEKPVGTSELEKTPSAEARE
jgi:phosphate starvation-inducible PhoH-like protein